MKALWWESKSGPAVEWAKQGLKRERLSAMPIDNWYRSTGMLDLRQKGALMDALQYAWLEPDQCESLSVIEIVRKSIHARFRRQVDRIVDAEFEKAFKRIRPLRRPRKFWHKQDLWDAAGGKCTYCRVDLTMEKRQPNTFVVDHIKPVAKGGTSALSNLTAACRTCNSRKKDKSPEAWSLDVQIMRRQSAETAS